MEDSDRTQKRKAFIINILYFVIILFFLYLAFKYLIFIIMPFVVGFGIAFMLKPIIGRLSERLKRSRKITAAFVVLLFYLTIGTLLTFLALQLYFLLKDLFYAMPSIYTQSIEPSLKSLLDNVNNWIESLDVQFETGFTSTVNNFLSEFGSTISKFSMSLVTAISGFAVSVPEFVVQVLFAIISSFFFSMDYYKVTSFIVRQLPENTKSLVFDIKDYIVGTIFKYIKSYSFIMLITFAELAVGFLILRIENAILVALLIAFFDILPVLGTGGIVIPWTVIEFIRGNFPVAIGLLVIYIIVTVVRNVLEPKIVGKQVGLHPLVTLMCMFLGVKLFGFIGLFLLPVSAVIIKNLNDSGRIHLLK